MPCYDDPERVFSERIKQLKIMANMFNDIIDFINKPGYNFSSMREYSFREFITHITRAMCSLGRDCDPELLKKNPEFIEYILGHWEYDRQRAVNNIDGIKKKIQEG